MKQILSLIAVMALSLTSMGASNPTLDELDEAISKAKGESKLVMVKFLMVRELGSPTSFATDWLMNKHLLGSKKMSEFLDDKVVSLHVPMAASAKGVIAKKLAVRTTSTLVILNGEGEEVHRMVGYRRYGYDHQGNVKPAATGINDDIDGIIVKLTDLLPKEEKEEKDDKPLKNSTAQPPKDEEPLLAK